MPRRHRSQSPPSSGEDPPRSTARRRRRKRRRDAQSGSDTESSSELVAEKSSKKQKTEYTPVEEKIRTAGRGFGIFYEMWRPHSTIIEKGIDLSTADPSILPDVDRVYADSFRNLLTFSSTVKAELAREGSDKEKVGSLLDAAQSDTRRSHSSAVKRSVGDWHNFSPGLSKKDSSPRGWDHDECARLLCPPSIEWNEVNKQGLRDPRTCQQFKLGPGDFPRFLWEGETMDWTDPAIGFLRHPILFAALRHFVISPSNSANATSNTSTKSGYAKQCGVKHVTIESIAYVATMVRYALSGDSRFSASTGFGYKDMYYEIIKFTKVLLNAQVQQLLTVWDREVFAPTRSGSELENEGPDPDSLVVRLARQVEAARAHQN